MSNPFTTLKMAALLAMPSVKVKSRDRMTPGSCLGPEAGRARPARDARTPKSAHLPAFLPGERQLAHLFRASREFCLQL